MILLYNNMSGLCKRLPPRPGFLPPPPPGQELLVEATVSSCSGSDGPTMLRQVLLNGHPKEGCGGNEEQDVSESESEWTYESVTDDDDDDDDKEEEEEEEAQLVVASPKEAAAQNGFQYNGDGRDSEICNDANEVPKSVQGDSDDEYYWGEEEEEEEVGKENLREIGSDVLSPTNVTTECMSAGVLVNDANEAVNQEEEASPRSQELMNGDQLEDMLTRIKRLREERKKILDDMKVMKAAFQDKAEDDGDEEEEQTNKEEQQQTTKSKVAAEERLSSNDSGNDSSGITCFICHSHLSSRLNKGAAMHMGLSDGDPICPRALYLTEQSMAKIKSVASSSTLSAQDKYNLLSLSPMTWSDGGGGEAQEWAASADSFLEEMEARREKDKDEQEAVRNGSWQSSHVTTKEPSPVQWPTFTVATVPEEGAENADPTDRDLFPPSPPPPPPSLQASVDMLELRGRLLSEICSPSPPPLSRVPMIDDRSEAAVRGKVLRPDLAPTVAQSSFRRLLRQISDEDGDRVKRRLKKVATRDRSAPYLPDDMEVFCVGDTPVWDREKEMERRQAEAEARQRVR